MSDHVANPDSPLASLARERQSVWLDYMHRTMLKSGELKTLIETRNVRGATSNPTIFEHAIGKSDAYDDAIVPWIRRLTDEVHEHGAACMIQLTHLGRRTGWSHDDWLPVIAPVARATAATTLCA